MIRGNDFILNPDKLQEEFQLVEVSDFRDLKRTRLPWILKMVI